MITDKTILVVGGAGFVGSHIVDKLLEEGVHKIIIYDNFCRGIYKNIEKASNDPRVEIIKADILQEDILNSAVSRADAVIDLAALWLLQCRDYPRAAFNTNIRGTFNILEACRKHKIRRLIYSSSASVYGNAIESPMTEEHPYNNETFYGATKIASEHLFKAYHYGYKVDGVCLRYTNIYGPRQDFKGVYVAVIIKMIDNILRGKPLEIHGDGSQSYDFVYVGDVARANILALKAKVPFGFYNVGTGIKTSILKLSKMLLDICDSDLEVLSVPAGQTFVTDRVSDPRLAQLDLGFSASVSLEEGLERLVSWRKSLI